MTRGRTPTCCDLSYPIVCFYATKSRCERVTSKFQMCVCSAAEEVAMFRFSFLTHLNPSSQLCFKAFGPPVVPLARQYTHTHARTHANTHTQRVTFTAKAAAQLQTKRPTSDTQTFHHGSWGTCLLSPFAIFRPQA